MGNIVESVMQYDAVNARCTDVGQQNSCKILADDAKSLIELYSSNPGARKMFHMLRNTEKPDYQV